MLGKLKTVFQMTAISLMLWQTPLGPIPVYDIGYFLLFPGDYKEFAQSGLYAALSLGNVFFYFSTGYFDIPSESKGLLHTWSLGVEEQFYLIWPLVMIGLLSAAKGRRAAMAWPISAFAMASSRRSNRRSRPRRRVRCWTSRARSSRPG